LLITTGCDTSGTGPEPPDPEIEGARGSIWAELVPDPGYWHGEMVASAKVVEAGVRSE